MKLLNLWLDGFLNLLAIALAALAIPLGFLAAALLTASHATSDLRSK